MTERNHILAKPKSPYKKSGSKGMGESQGSRKTAPRRRKFLPYEEAHAFACSLNLKSNYEWRNFCQGLLPAKGKLPKNIPSSPHHTYAEKGWKSWGDWLGTGEISTVYRVFRPFKNARKFIHSLNLKSELEWRYYCKGELTAKGTRPHDIPSNPNHTYAEQGWKGYGDWLGTGRISNKLRVHRSFEEAREFVRSQHLKSTKEWLKFTKGQMPEKGTLPSDIPANPCGAYRNKGWLGIGDWLGTGVLATKFRRYRSFHDARTFVHALNLRNRDEWRKFCMRKMPEKGTLPSDIPTNPRITYAKSGWVNTANWLGK